MSDINFYNMDNIEFMKTKPDNYYDLAIVDPPYKKNTSGLSAGFNRKHFNYDTLSQPPTKEYIAELNRVSRDVIMWGFNYYLELLKNTDACIIWNKHQNGHFSEAELACSSIGKTRIFDRPYQKDIGNKIHPTQKPVALYRWILQNYAKKGFKILDTHGGSHTNAIACDIEGFDLDIIEIDKEYSNDGLKAFNEYKRQPTLF